MRKWRWYAIHRAKHFIKINSCMLNAEGRSWWKSDSSYQNVNGFIYIELYKARNSQICRRIRNGLGICADAFSLPTHSGSMSPPILFSTDFDGFFYWDECSQKWCNSLLISSQFSTMNCIIINWSWLNSLLIIIKYSTIHWENALFSTESIRILYWFWRDSLLIWGTFSTVRLN